MVPKGENYLQEVDEMVDHASLNSIVDLDEVVRGGKRMLAHRCSPRCLVMVVPGVFQCRN